MVLNVSNCLSQDRENNLSSQIATLESSVSRLQAELEKAKAMPSRPEPVAVYQNGHGTSPPRPDSRASTAFGGSPGPWDRAGTPVARINGNSSARSDTPPTSSVWDSMHAPKTARESIHAPKAKPREPIHAPKAVPRPRYPHLGPAATKSRSPSYMQRAASPTPSTVSAAPTQGDDGWWS